jgi:hypothetical protein
MPTENFGSTVGNLLHHAPMSPWDSMRPQELLSMSTKDRGQFQRNILRMSACH